MDVRNVEDGQATPRCIPGGNNLQVMDVGRKPETADAGHTTTQLRHVERKKDEEACLHFRNPNNNMDVKIPNFRGRLGIYMVDRIGVNTQSIQLQKVTKSTHKASILRIGVSAM